MQGIKRRVVYISLYEGLAIVAASLGLAAMSGEGLGHSGVLAVIASVIAVLWNLAFNALFERWESAPGGARPEPCVGAWRMRSASKAGWSLFWCRCSHGSWASPSGRRW